MYLLFFPYAVDFQQLNNRKRNFAHTHMVFQMVKLRRRMRRGLRVFKTSRTKNIHEKKTFFFFLKRKEYFFFPKIHDVGSVSQYEFSFNLSSSTV